MGAVDDYFVNKWDIWDRQKTKIGIYAETCKNKTECEKKNLNNGQ